MLRKIEPSDVSRIEQIYKSHHASTFGMPNLNKALDHTILEQDGKVIALGAIKQLVEAMIVLDLDLPKSTRVKTIIKLLDAAIIQSKNLKIEQLHAFIKDEKYAKLLIERFGFKRITDVPLVLNIEG